MTTPVTFEFLPTELDQVATHTGQVVCFVEASGKLDQSSRRVNRLSKGALERFAESEAFAEMSESQARELAYPAGMDATGVIVVKLARKPEAGDARKAGVSIGKLKNDSPLLVLAGNIGRAAEICEGIALRVYSYTEMKSEDPKETGNVILMASKPEEVAAAAAAPLAVAEGVFFTRDLTNAPANHLTTTNFAEQLAAMTSLGLEVEVLEEPQLEELGMRTLLSVGQGSSAPSKVVVMSWKGGGDEAPFALVGKGVVFDTGGLSLKPAGGMEDMTMDMGGAGVVSGVMRALALRKAKANVVGLVGLVENMPGPDATRPGDVVTSMKGDTVEIINTDAEGRLVLADVLWYAQERFKPVGMINLATLTGAIIIGLGHEMAGVFSNSDDLSDKFLKAAKDEDEGAWRMPLSPAYDKQLKSAVADMKNVGGRPAGSITAGQFLQRFVLDEMPWAHLDIAGVASVKSDTSYAPKGATGWGVRALNRMIADNYEG
ncbi:MAG: leucyl aminopeptidase [Rhodobacteraceae bacterium]|nr:leucyl aminopeptidase [Paracoccaceae bacterium]